MYKKAFLLGSKAKHHFNRTEFRRAFTQSLIHTESVAQDFSKCYNHCTSFLKDLVCKSGGEAW